jgi:hypothetical protein
MFQDGVVQVDDCLFLLTLINVCERLTIGAKQLLRNTNIPLHLVKHWDDGGLSLIHFVFRQ